MGFILLWVINISLLKGIFISLQLRDDVTFPRAILWYLFWKWLWWNYWNEILSIYV